MTEISFASPEFRADPYPTYAALRREEPVHLSPVGYWAISRYDDVVHVLKNPAIFSSAAMSMDIAGRPTTTVINADPPLHTRLRNIVSRAFTPRMVADMEPRIREITATLLDRVAATGEIDYVRDLAIPLPVTVIAEILGVDPAHGEDFKRWSNAIIGNAASNADAVVDASGSRDDDQREFREYFARVIEERRREPRGDLISALAAAQDDDHQLTADEVLAFTGLLLIAGNETTTNLLGSAMLALLEHPEQLQLVRDDRSLVPALVEEALRYDSPVQLIIRMTTEDTTVGDHAIPKGAPVLPLFASANRDERRFPEPDTFDIRRNTQGHMAFGHGVHFCLGAPLARLEAKVALEETLRRLPSLARTMPNVDRINSMLLRGLASLPLRFDTVPVA